MCFSVAVAARETEGEKGPFHGRLYGRTERLGLRTLALGRVGRGGGYRWVG